MPQAHNEPVPDTGADVEESARRALCSQPRPVSGRCATTHATSATRPAIRSPASRALPGLSSHSHHRLSSTARGPTACAENAGFPAHWWHNTSTGPPRWRSGALDMPHADRAHPAESHRPRISLASAPPPTSPALPSLSTGVHPLQAMADYARVARGPHASHRVPYKAKPPPGTPHAPPEHRAAPVCCPYHPPLPLGASRRAVVLHKRREMARISWRSEA